jgi:hypothetical protein
MWISVPPKKACYNCRNHEELGFFLLRPMLRAYGLSIKEAKDVPTVLCISKKTLYTLIHAVTEGELRELKAIGTNLGRPRSLLFAQHSAIREIASKRYGTCPRHLGLFDVIFGVKPGFTHIG